MGGEWSGNWQFSGFVIWFLGFGNGCVPCNLCLKVLLLSSMWVLELSGFLVICIFKAIVVFINMR